MFGFQRFFDFAWAAGDAQCRGFLIGATSGRTTLAGEGLQHQDGHSLVMASTIPNCVTYDPTFSYELAVIFEDGLKRMHEKQENVFYYITTLNENYKHPAMPKGAKKEDILKGMYLFKEINNKGKTKVQLLGSGAILNEVIKAAEILSSDFGIDSDIWSVTSFNELRKDAIEVERKNLLNPDKKPEKTYIEKCFEKRTGPFIAATDYIRTLSEGIRNYVPGTYVTLDGAVGCCWAPACSGVSGVPATSNPWAPCWISAACASGWPIRRLPLVPSCSWVGGLRVPNRRPRASVPT
jgi:pyruvate dehydrogenase E1 component